MGGDPNPTGEIGSMTPISIFNTTEPASTDKMPSLAELKKIMDDVRELRCL